MSEHGGSNPHESEGYFDRENDDERSNLVVPYLVILITNSGLDHINSGLIYIIYLSQWENFALDVSHLFRRCSRVFPRCTGNVHCHLRLLGVRCVDHHFSSASFIRLEKELQRRKWHIQQESSQYICICIYIYICVSHHEIFRKM